MQAVTGLKIDTIKRLCFFFIKGVQNFSQHHKCEFIICNINNILT